MKDKINIMFMINNLYGGGAENILQTLLNQLDQDKYNITLYGVVNEKFDTKIYPKGIKYKSVFSGLNNAPRKQQYGFTIKLKNKIKLFIYNYLSAEIFYKLFVKGDYDVEVAFIEGYSTKIISGSSSNSTKIAWVHIDLEANHWTTIAYKNLKDEIKAYNQFDNIVSVSNSVQEAFSRKFGITENLKIKYNPVDRNKIIKKSKTPLDEKYINSTFKLISVGRLEPQKGYDRLIKVCKKLIEDGFDFTVDIIGEGNQRKELETAIEQSNLKKIVNLMGFHSNPYKFIRASDLFICSSRTEGFSTVVTEALILGKPIVATDCAGMNELLGESEYGLITENNEAGLYSGLKAILSDKKLYGHYQKKSEERGRTFEIIETLKEVEKLWRP